MSISGISTNPYQLGATYQQQIQQLGQALQSGNLSSAQSDFATLQQSFSQAVTGSGSTGSSNTITQAFNQHGSDLHSGNLSAAQKDLATVKQDLQSNCSAPINHFRQSFGSLFTTSGPNKSTNNPAQVSGTPASNNFSGAQQAYSLAQTFQQAALGAGSNSAFDAEDESPFSLVA